MVSRQGEFVSLKAMILAAGEGTRLRPLTLDRPKPMLPVAGRPMLEHTIAWLRYYGITQIAINLYHRPRVVMDGLGDGRSFGVRIAYSLETTILGTAGGVRRMAGFLDGTFVLVYGDVLTDLPLDALIDFHVAQSSGPHLSMSLYHVPNPSECGIVDLDDESRISRFVEKPLEQDVFSDLAHSGVSVLDPELLELIPDDRCYDFGRDLFPRLLETGVPMYGWTLPRTSYLIDIGTPEKYARAQREWPTLAARRFLVSDRGSE
jgi:NDP-sugar pyrophosphorylase family protein